MNVISSAYEELQDELNQHTEEAVRDIDNLIDEYQQPLDLSIYVINDEDEKAQIEWEQLCNEFSINWSTIDNDPSEESNYTIDLNDNKAAFEKVCVLCMYMLMFWFECDLNVNVSVKLRILYL